jgi:hypothetical protein
VVGAIRGRARLPGSSPLLPTRANQLKRSVLNEDSTCGRLTYASGVQDLDLDLAAAKAAQRFDRRHPVLSGAVSSLLFMAIGVLSVLFAAYLIRTEGSVGLVVAMVVGTAVGASGAAVWVYAFAHEFAVPVWLGRLLFVLTLATLVGALGAFTGIALVQAVSATMLASRLLPQAVFALILAREDVRHPETRRGSVRRAMTMASWPRLK